MGDATSNRQDRDRGCGDPDPQASPRLILSLGRREGLVKRWRCAPEAFLVLAYCHDNLSTIDTVEQGALRKRRLGGPKTDKAPEGFRATGHSLEQGTGASRLRSTVPGSSPQIGRCRESPREKI
jgi:hypothetical protein